MKNFEECRRMYWFGAYGMWDGWDARADARTKEIYILSKLKNRWMWVGEVVHNAVAELLETYRAGGTVAEIDIRERMRVQWKSSRDEVYRQPRKAKTTALIEHDYNIKVDDWKEVALHAETCFQNFLQSSYHNDLKELTRDQWLGIEELDSFFLDESRVFVKLDAVHRTSDGIRIVDWKTGRKESESDPFQLAVYALYANDAWRIPPDKIEVHEVNLTRGKVYNRMISAPEIEKTQGEMIASIREMKAQLASSPEENIAQEKDYPVTEDAFRCRNCRFQKVCTDRPAS